MKKQFETKEMEHRNFEITKLNLLGDEIQGNCADGFCSLPKAANSKVPPKQINEEAEKESVQKEM
jgi:hypothetical protein